MVRYDAVGNWGKTGKPSGGKGGGGGRYGRGKGGAPGPAATGGGTQRVDSPAPMMQQQQGVQSMISPVMAGGGAHKVDPPVAAATAAP
eukprot:4849739-Karenia_brevis.AAC.1